MFRGFFLPPCWTEETRKVRKTAYKILFLRPIQKPSISRRFFKKKKKKENNSTSRGKDLLFKWNWRGAEMHKYRFRFELNEDKKRMVFRTRKKIHKYKFRGEISSTPNRYFVIFDFFFQIQSFIRRNCNRIRFDKHRGGKFIIQKFFNDRPLDICL